MEPEEVADRMFYPPAEIAPKEFEEWVADVYATATPRVDDLRVDIHDRIDGLDGSYTFDATVRYRLHGLEFVVIVEAKQHKNPIKRELVQVLHSKVQSVGAHKGVMVSTAPYQKGALDYAKAHGLALVTVTESRFTYETRSAGESPILTRDEAMARWPSLPVFAGHVYTAGSTDGSTNVTLVSTEFTGHVPELLLGIAAL